MHKYLLSSLPLFVSIWLVRQTSSSPFGDPNQLPLVNGTCAFSKVGFPAHGKPRQNAVSGIVI